jgi:hypothetical protein
VEETLSRPISAPGGSFELEFDRDTSWIAENSQQIQSD